MERREFLKNVTAGTLGIAGVGSAALLQSTKANDARKEARKEKRVKMYVGCQSHGGSEETMSYLARCGVYNYDPGMPKTIAGKGWDLEDSLAIVERAAKYGVTIDAYHLPLSSAGIDRVTVPNIMLGKSPERDREIEMIQQMIQVSAQSGVKLLLYNTTILPVVRTGRTVDPKRGFMEYSTFNLEEARSRGLDKELTKAGLLDVDTVFERITYLLDRLLPVAEEYGVRLGNHIADPPLPVGYAGMTRWNSPDVFEGIKRFAQLYDSPSHGFNFCIGSIAEGLKDPDTEIHPIIEWTGARKQIFNIHYRNIKGGWGNFQEVMPDNGDMDFVKVMRTLRDVGFDGMVMPDHVPYHSDPENKRHAYAFCYGYIKALLQMLENEA
jgi:mannonate dehydratase